MPLPLLLVGRWQSLVLLNSQMPHPDPSPQVHTKLSPCTWIIQTSPLDKDTSHTRLGLHGHPPPYVLNSI